MLRTGSVSWSQGDAAELLEVEFQGIARLLNLPVGDARPGGKGAQEDLDFPATQLAPRTARIVREELSHPSQAIGDGFLLGAGCPQNLDVPGRPARLRVDRRRRPNVQLTHIRSSTFPVCVKLDHPFVGCQCLFLTHSAPSGPAMFDA